MSLRLTGSCQRPMEIGEEYNRTKPQAPVLTHTGFSPSKRETQIMSKDATDPAHAGVAEDECFQNGDISNC